MGCNNPQKMQQACQIRKSYTEHDFLALDTSHNLQKNSGWRTDTSQLLDQAKPDPFYLGYYLGTAIATHENW